MKIAAFFCLASLALAARAETDTRLHADGNGWRLDRVAIADPARPRVLLIGDSILNGYLQQVITGLHGRAYVDAWVNPYCQSEHLNQLLADVLTNGPYDVVHFNMGLHGWQEGRIKPGTFEPLTKAYVDVLRAKLPNARLVWASSTPVTVKGKPAELDPAINPVILEHNRMAAKVMAEAGVPVSDFYALLVDHREWARGDQFHWTAPAYDLLARTVVASVEKALSPAGPGVAGRLPADSRASLADHVARPFIFADPGFYHWGGTPIRGDDGQYHLFYDRWPRDNPRGMYGWLYITEIAHATAPRPEGPYTFRNVALQSAGDDPPGRWDAVNTHNACIARFPHPDTGRPTYYLYYIANRGDRTTSDPWLVHVGHQRIGVAWSESPDGPWTRHPEPVAQPGGPLQHYVVNPGVTRLPDGRYLMALKGRAAVPGKPKEWGPMLHGWALADKPTGPFVIQPTLLFPGSVSAEDPCVWVQDGRVFAAVKDWHGKLSGTPGIAWVYGDVLPGGDIRWTVPPRPLITGRALAWDDGAETKLYALERPYILLGADGKPSHLFAAACQGDEFTGCSQTPKANPPPVRPEHLPFNVCIPLVPDSNGGKTAARNSP